MDAAAITYFGRIMARALEKWLDETVGEAQFCKCVQHNILITDLLPVEFKTDMKSKVTSYIAPISKTTNQQVYDLLPKKYKALLDALPGGKAYGLRQIQVVREYLLA